MNTPIKPKDNVVKWLKVIIPLLAIASIGAVIFALFLQSASIPSSLATTEPESKPEYMLQCISWSNYSEYGYIHVVGEVKNISNTKLENVMAVVAFRTEDGTLVKTDDALIDYDVLMPGQTCSFEVLTTENPAIKKLGLSFKQLFGSQIPTKFD